MNVVFAGTSEFAVPSLENLIASAHDVLAVITQPDKPKGRGRGVHTTLVKEIALAHSIPVLQPEKIRDPVAIAEIRSYEPVGAMVVVAYGQKITTDLLTWPRYGVVNVHGSILPKYRGAAPIQHAIIAGETQTGVTTMLMNEGLDTGDILLQETLDILPHETAGELSPRLALLGADLLIRTLDDLEAGEVAPIPQDDELATQARSLPRDAGVIDWSRAANDIVNRIRGCTPKPGAFTRINGVMIKVWSAAIENLECGLGEPGTVIDITRDALIVAAANGSVRVCEVQPESRQRMSATDYARGAKLAPGDRFDIRFEMPL
ncbi:MAG: methionyl-tRNA formyltransferase [Armatimonadetes bacterium]|nr:methionyl-tRNA formyltransferase [Armatimonadota bacterium]